jgi:hypothetical protein
VFEVNLADDGVVNRTIADQDIVDGCANLVRLDTDPARRVALGVAVNEERPLFGGCEARGQVDGGRGFPTPPFWFAIAMTRAT